MKQDGKVLELLKQFEKMGIPSIDCVIYHKGECVFRYQAGFSDEERAKFSELLASGFVDTFRALYPEKVEYSWWSYMMKAREKNVGWRIDYFVVSERLFARVKDSFILGSVMGSDHCPVGIELEEGENR